MTILEDSCCPFLMGGLLLKEKLALFGKDTFAIQKRLQEFLSGQLQQKVSAFVICRNFLEALGQCRPRSDCSCRSSLFLVQTVCLYTTLILVNNVSKNMQQKT